jgi:asparagine synthase (glutamine-hydrolysing)
MESDGIHPGSAGGGEHVFLQGLNPQVLKGESIMAGIAGIAQPGKQELVNQMLGQMAHRGPAGREVLDGKNATLGLAWTFPQAEAVQRLRESHQVRDGSVDGHEALASGDEILLKRDPLGIAPLYYGRNTQGILCFASEAKGLHGIAHEVYELLPGHSYDGNQMSTYYNLEKLAPMDEPADVIARELHQKLETSISKRIGDGNVGAWLSGGLDSSAMASLARPHVSQLHTFAAGVPGAPDLEYARQVAKFIQASHHEVIVQLKELLAVLPEVIYHLESFDALLVRSSAMNYLVARLASEFVPAIFSGEGGDELFAGYDYLKTLDPVKLPDELLDITARLHNTALQRVDRCAAAHGTVAHVGFLDPDVVDLALRIPAKYKLHEGVEKWILRRALDGTLPESVVERPKAKFWQGAGVEDLLAEYASDQINDTEFLKERRLSNGWVLNSKEELFYYRIFREHFGEFKNLDWIGRTKGVPTDNLEK